MSLESGLVAALPPSSLPVCGVAIIALGVLCPKVLKATHTFKCRFKDAPDDVKALRNDLNAVQIINPNLRRNRQESEFRREATTERNTRQPAGDHFAFLGALLRGIRG